MFKITKIILPPISLKIRLGGIFLLNSPILGAYFYGYSGNSSPFHCPILAFTGIPCPGCGLTRSFLSIVKGDIFLSFSDHLFGPFLFVFLLLVTTHLFLEIATKRKVKNYYLKILQYKGTQYLILLSILIYYFSKLLFLYSNGTLTHRFQLSPLADLIYN